MGHLNRFHSGIVLALILLVVALLVNFSQVPYYLGFNILGFRISSSPSDIDDFIYGLNYSNNEILVYKGDSKTSVLSKLEGKLDDEHNFIVISREWIPLKNKKSDIGVVANIEHKTYPGNLLLANSRLLDNTPDILATDRAPLRYTVNLPGLTADEGSFEVAPSFSSYQAAVNKVLRVWFEKHPDGHNIVAIFQNDMSFAYSPEQMRVKFGLEFKNSPIESNIDFRAMEKQEKLILVHRFKQIFYTVSIESKKRPSDLFASSVTVNELKEKTNEDSPPVIVESVSYGRIIYVKLETSSTDEEAKLLLNNGLLNIKTKNENEIFKKLENLRITVYVLGGSTEQIELINARTVQEVKDVIIRYSKFSRANLGFPISYSARFIKDNAGVVVKMSTDYVESTREIFKKGVIKVVHKGWFVMQWGITWKERNYDKYGNLYMVEKSWDRNWQSLTAPFHQEIELPGNTQEIRVIAKVKTGLIWDPWRTEIDRSGIPLVDYRTFEVWGTTLNSQSDIY